MSVEVKSKKLGSCTPLGEIYQNAKEWQRKKVVEELKEIGFAYSSFASYLTKTPAYHTPGDVRDIILENFPEAEPLFKRPVKN